MNRLIALALCSALAAQGCATTGTTASMTASTAEPRLATRAVLAEYVQKLPLGATIRVARVKGRTVTGTLMKATDQSIVVQPRTRIPEPPVELSLDDVVSVTLEKPNGTSIAKAIGVGAGAGAAAALAVILILIAAYAD